MAEDVQRVSLTSIVQAGVGSEFTPVRVDLTYTSSQARQGYLIQMKRVSAYCEECEGQRNFSTVARDLWSESEGPLPFLAFRMMCDDCKQFVRQYLVQFKALEKLKHRIPPNTGFDGLGRLAFADPPLVSRFSGPMSKLIGGERDLFFKGRRAELEGLGIGAFAYYRRAMETTKLRLIDEVKSVAEQLGGMEDLIKELDLLAAEPQFAKALPYLKHALPPSLDYAGQNPLKVLYQALSVGMHGRSDEECLELAELVRAVLVDLSEKLSAAKRSDREARAALTILAKFNKDAAL